MTSGHLPGCPCGKTGLWSCNVSVSKTQAPMLTPTSSTLRDSDKDGLSSSVITSGFFSLILWIILMYHYLILKSRLFLFIHFPALFSFRSCPSPPSPAVSLCDVTRPSSACFAPISAPSPAIDGLMMPPALSHEINLLCFCFNLFFDSFYCWQKQC